MFSHLFSVIYFDTEMYFFRIECIFSTSDFHHTTQLTEKTNILFFFLNVCIFLYTTSHTARLSFLSVVYCRSYSRGGGVEPLRTPFTVRTQREECSYLTFTLCIHLFTDNLLLQPIRSLTPGSLRSTSS